MDSKVGQLHSCTELLATEFKQGGERNCIDEAIALDREALELCPPGHSMRPVSLTSLSIHLSDRYNQFGEMMDLEEAIVVGRDALALRTPGHPDRPVSLNNLANRLSARCRQRGAIEDVNEAICFGREALDLRPPGHPDRSTSLNNLASHLSYRYKQLGAIADLNESISLGRNALELCPPGHPARSKRLNNLANSISDRYKQLGTPEDLNEAIVLGQEALETCPPRNQARSKHLNNLANALFSRYKQIEEIVDLNKAIDFAEDALTLCPPGHPARSRRLNNLARYLSHRYEQLRAPGDLDEAIALAQDALSLCPVGHPDRPWSLESLAFHLRLRFTRLNRLKDKEELFSLYTQIAHIPPTMSSTDLSAARTWIRVAEEFEHSTTLLAYETSLRLLIHHLAALPSLPQHLDVFKSLTSSLAVDAFSACLRNHSLTKAVELLEQGRGVFWSQLARLRSPLDDVITSSPTGESLADEFRQLTSLIRNAIESPGADQHDRVCRLNVDLERVVTHIRELPGLSRFLLPSLFSNLQQSASGGPVIIVNASSYSCDALIVLLDRDPIHVPLRITRDRARMLTMELRGLTTRTKCMNVAKYLAGILVELWQKVVSPIVDVLQMIHPPQSRIWWCPTAEFSLLPLHAAGSYKRGQRNISDIYISSYTPTLTALIRARRCESTGSANEERNFVAIGQANAVGETELVSVSAELTSIGQRVEGLAAFNSVEGEESSISRVAEELMKNEWAHLACHGVPNRSQPFDSAFSLHDGHFTVERIIRCELQKAQFAYLSACHTTVGDEGSPDEMIHLASAMQFAGFRSVIGTMWAVDDRQTEKITSMFYGNMKDESGRLDHTRAAFALHKTMQTLADISFDQRILYVHLGA